MFVVIDTYFFITSCILRVFRLLKLCMSTHPTKNSARSSAAMQSQYSEKLTRKIRFILGSYVLHMMDKGAKY